jgi:5-methylcytosine-specific restriction endonuclease McrBC regulatory subunit McrC
VKAKDPDLLEVGSVRFPDLTREEAREIQLIAGEGESVRIGVRGDPSASGWILEGKGYTGAVTLSTGRTIRIGTKVPVDSIFHMLRFARSGFEFFDPASQYAKSEDFFEVLVAEFARRCAELLRYGLHQGYVEETDDRLLALRGRLLVSTQLRRNFIDRQRFACRFVEFTADLPLNQALKLATFLASRLEYRRRETRDELEENLRQFGGVSFVQMDAETPVRIVLDRLTEPYRVPLALASLIIGSVSLEDQIGGITFASYLVDMKTLFQQYVAATLRDAFAGTGMRVQTQIHHDLDADGLFEYIPDIEIWRGQECIVLIDTKYKRYEPRVGGKGGPSYPDMYQVYAYRDGLKARQVVLLYPEVVPASEVVRRFVGKLDIYVKGVDLAGSPAELDTRAGTFATELVALATATAAAA